MAHVRKGLLTAAGEWWKHLKWTKRVYWHGERRAAKDDVREQLRDRAWDTDEREGDVS